MIIKTIDINAKEWFDKVNGNSYFAGQVTVNYGTSESVSITLPYQYGYGNHFVEMAKQALQENGFLNDLKQYPNGSNEPLWNYCDDRGIILRSNKQTGCKKRDLKAY